MIKAGTENEPTDIFVTTFDLFEMLGRQYLPPPPHLHILLFSDPNTGKDTKICNLSFDTVNKQIIFNPTQAKENYI